MSKQYAVGCDSLPSYLLGELSSKETDQFLAHRLKCPRCQAELKEIGQAHRILLEGEVDAECGQIAAAARERTLAAAFAERSPQDAVDRADAPVNPVSPTGDKGRPQTQIADAPEAAPSWTFPPRRSLHARFARIQVRAIGATIAALLIGLFIGARLATPPAPPPTLTIPAEIVRQASLAATSAAPAAHGTLTLVRRGAMQQMIVSVAGLPAASADGCYSVWLVDGRVHRLFGEINVNAAGEGVLTADLGKNIPFTYVGITREPSRTDRTPRGPRIMGTPLRQPARL